MPDPIRRAFEKLFNVPPSQSRQSLYPSRSAVPSQVRNPTHAAMNALFDVGLDVPNPQFAGQPHGYAEMRRPTLLESARASIPGFQMFEPTVLDVLGPLGKGAKFLGIPAMMGMQKRAKELGLITRVREGNFPYHHIEVFDPQLQTRYIGKKVMGREIDRMGGYDARGQYGGSVAAFVDFQKRPQLTSAGEDLFRLETGLEMKEKPPMYKVAFAKGLGRPDPKNPGDPFSDISIDPAYSGRALEELLQLGAREHPGKIYSVEAELANAGLMRLAENFGILGYEHGYGNNALYFAKKGRFLPLSKAMEEIGVAGPNLGGRTAQQVASEYGLTKKLKKGQARQQRLDYMDLRRRMEAAGTPIPDPNEVPPSAIDWMGEGRDYARTSSDEGPIGFNDVPPSQWDDAYINSYEQAFDYGVDVTDAILSTNPRMDLDTLAAELRAANVEPDIVGEIIQDIQYDRAHGRSGRR